MKSATFFTAQVDFEQAGELKVFIDDQQLKVVEQLGQEHGYLDGRYMATTFNLLRGNDLIWNYVVKNYLLGDDYPAFDLLHWNGDVTNLPAKWHQAYLKDLYRDNKLVEPDALTMCGVKVNVRDVDMPAFVMAAREDHIVPWKGGYESARYLGGPVTFVLGASGHIAGSINPASKNKRSYWVNDRLGPNPDKWFEQSKEVPGSWWNDWAKWLLEHRGELVDAPRQCGAGRFKPIEPAPGSYVRVRAAAGA